MSATTPPISPKLIGQTEKTLNAILQRIIGDRISEPEWVSLVVLSGAGSDLSRAEATDLVAGALKLNASDAAEVLDALAQRRLFDSPLEGTQAVTPAGRELLHEVRIETERVTQRLWGDLPADELDVAARVLATILERAERELAVR
jgi:hypothetical protein